MKLCTKSLYSLLIATVLGVGVCAASNISSFEFLGAVARRNEAKNLVFEVKQTSQIIGENLHTIYIVKAVVIKSGLEELRPGSVFEGCFDRFYSIFDAPALHPLSIGDLVEVGVIRVDKNTIIGFLKNKSRANRAPETTPAPVMPAAYSPVTPSTGAAGALALGKESIV